MIDNKTTTNRKVAKIQVDRKACIGAATCVIVAAKAFEIDEEGIAIVMNTALEMSEEELISAARSCPASAIKLFDSQGVAL